MTNPTLTEQGATAVSNLQIVGKNQLVKEMNECAGLATYEAGVSQQNQKKIFHDIEALHRNEITGEQEPTSEVDEYLDSVNRSSPRDPKIVSGTYEKEKATKEFKVIDDSFERMTGTAPDKSAMASRVSSPMGMSVVETPRRRNSVISLF